MRAHYLQHVSFEGLGTIEPWLKETGYEIARTLFFESANVPDPKDIDLLVILGGPMSVNDEKKHPWLVQEKRFIREVIESGKSVLEVCLGAQMIASAMGANVYPNSEKEIGWFPVTSVSPKKSSSFSFPFSFEAFHWHGETFDLPPGANLLASSTACKNQAFQIGTSVIGLQFHLEMTPESAQELISICRDELIPSTFIQTEKEILSANTERYHVANQIMDQIHSYLHRQ